MTPETQAPHSFNRPSLVLRERSSHRRYNSEPFNALLGPRYALSLFPGHGEILLRPLSQLDPNAPPLAAPAPVSLRRTKLQYSIRRPRPNTECFGVSESRSPEIVLGEPKEHIGHPKTRIGQPVLKLAAIKERLEHLEATNDRLQQRIESYKTDAEMLSSSVTYFSSEYYAGLLTIRDLRARSQQDAEIMSKQEHQLCQLKKFVGLMVEIGLHEPVLERAHQSVIAGEDIEPVLVEAIRNAASRRGSAWSGILSAVDLNTPSTICPPSVTPDVVFTTDAPDVFEEHRQSTVDNLLKDLKDGNIPVGRHRSASHRLASPACKQSLRVKSPNALLSPSSPARRVLGKLDVNRSPPRQTRQRSDDSKKVCLCLVFNIYLHLGNFYLLDCTPDAFLCCWFRCRDDGRPPHTVLCCWFRLHAKKGTPLREGTRCGRRRILFERAGYCLPAAPARQLQQREFRLPRVDDGRDPVGRLR